jgi:hypothetical protein
MDDAVGSLQTKIGGTQTHRIRKRNSIGRLCVTDDVHRIVGGGLPHSLNAALENKVIDPHSDDLADFKKRTTGLKAVANAVGVGIDKLTLSAAVHGAFFLIAIVAVEDEPPTEHTWRSWSGTCWQCEHKHCRKNCCNNTEECYRSTD